MLQQSIWPRPFKLPRTVLFRFPRTSDQENHWRSKYSSRQNLNIWRQECPQISTGLRFFMRSRQELQLARTCRKRKPGPAPGFSCRPIASPLLSPRRARHNQRADGSASRLQRARPVRVFLFSLAFPQTLPTLPCVGRHTPSCPALARPCGIFYLLRFPHSKEDRPCQTT